MLYCLFVTKAYIERVKTLEQTLPLIAEPMNPVSGRTRGETISVFIADHPVVTYGVSATLGGETDINVVGESSDGWQAIAEIQRLQPDVVLLELDLPSAPGSEMLKRLSYVAPDTAVIIFTSLTKEDHMLGALQTGAKGYILKDIEVAEITSAIRIVHSGEVFISPSMASKLVGNFLNREKADRVPDTYQRLSAREREVLSLLADGMNNKAIAEHLSVSPYTVQTYRQRIMRKLDLHSGTELLRYAFRKGLITIES
jgi:two-component system response regulator NreC